MSAWIVTERTDSSPTSVTLSQPVPPKNLQFGASSGRSQSLYTLPSISQSKLNQQKAVASVTAGVVPNKNQVLSNASVSCYSGQEESHESPGDLNCYTKTNEEKSCLVWHCLSVECFDSLNLTASKQPGWKNVDICCWKTVYFLLLFLFYCDTGYLLFELCYFLEKRTWKDVDQRQDGYTGEKTVQVLFLGLLNYSLRSKACCIYNGYMSCLFYFYFFPKFKNKNIICFLFDYIALHSVLVKPCHLSVFTLM